MYEIKKYVCVSVLKKLPSFSLGFKIRVEKILPYTERTKCFQCQCRKRKELEGYENAVRQSPHPQPRNSGLHSITLRINDSQCHYAMFSAAQSQ